VPERFELSNEASCGAVGVGAGEVVTARVAVKLAGREHVPGGGEDRVAGSGHGFWSGRMVAGYCAARIDFAGDETGTWG
jgi:hypothetical protein